MNTLFESLATDFESIKVMEYKNFRLVDTLEEIESMPDKSVDVILTDPPYDFDEADKIFLHNAFTRIAKKAVIVFSPPENQWDFCADHYLFWVKPISTKNTIKSYSRFVEMIFVYELEDYTWNTQYHWSNYVNVINDKVLGLSDHPFEKPESLLERLIRLHTHPGDLIFDPFCGSGSVLNVAERLERYSLGWDINDEHINYYNVS